jgi:polyhydroxybutyrate depolymerase
MDRRSSIVLSSLWTVSTLSSLWACTGPSELSANTDDGSAATGEAGDTDMDAGTGTGESDDGEEPGETGGPEPSCDGDGLGSGDHTLTLDHDGRTRVATIHVPPGYDGIEPTPLVLNFHGFGSNGTQQAFFSYMNEVADAEGFVVVYPEGTANADGRRAWNSGACCSDDPTVDDIGFVAALIDELDTRLCVDEGRRFATGMSNGGMMSFAVGCELADQIAAIAPVAGLLALPPEDCAPTRPVAMWQVHGTIDTLVPFSGARDSAVYWAALNGCETSSSTTFQNGVVTCEGWACQAGDEVEFCTAEGVNHCWPGQTLCVDPPTTLDIDASAAIWAFFAAHPQ